MNLRKSIVAGMCIGLGGCIYLAIGGIVGALFFSLGLATIILLDLDLFTGKSCFVPYHKVKIQQLPTIILGNLIGTMIMAILASGINAEWLSKANDIVVARLSLNALTLFYKAILCGLFMFVAVVPAKTNLNPLSAFATVGGVMAFIMTGACHCIADMFYYCCCPTQILHICHNLIITITGNFIGCALPGFILMYKKR